MNGMEEWNAKVNLSQSRSRRSERWTELSGEGRGGCLNKKRSFLSVSARWRPASATSGSRFFFLPRSHLIPPYAARWGHSTGTARVRVRKDVQVPFVRVCRETEMRVGNYVRWAIDFLGSLHGPTPRARPGRAC